MRSNDRPRWPGGIWCRVWRQYRGGGSNRGSRVTGIRIGNRRCGGLEGVAPDSSLAGLCCRDRCSLGHSEQREVGENWKKAGGRAVQKGVSGFTSREWVSPEQTVQIRWKREMKVPGGRAVRVTRVRGGCKAGSAKPARCVPHHTTDFFWGGVSQGCPRPV